MSKIQTNDLLGLWRVITTAGGIEAYVASELTRRGVLVKRRETDDMSPRDLEKYKKELKAEAEEKRKVRRQAWLAYKASHIVHLGEGVFWTDDAPRDPNTGKPVPDKFDLPNAAERAAENELPPLDNVQQLAEALEMPISQLRRLAFHREATQVVHYRQFLIPKRSGGTRAIWAPLPKLKAAQRWILQQIVEPLPVHGAVHGFFAGRSTITNADRHSESRVVLKMDIKDFFPTITLPRVKGLFRKAGYREQVATLLALLCTEPPREIVQEDGKTWYVALGPRCLPQGAPTSPAITNTLCLRLDQRLAGIAKRLGWRYTRYADDMTFSLPKGHKEKPRLGTLIGLVKRIVEAEGFAINAGKTTIGRSGARQLVTGLVVNGDKGPRTPRSLRRQLRAAAHNLDKGKPMKEGETRARLAGYAAYVQATDLTLGAKLTETFRPTSSADTAS